jgi:hypothetical protein
VPSSNRAARAIAAPSRFLGGPFGRWLQKNVGAPSAATRRAGALDFGVVPPRDLARFMEVLAGRRAGDFAPRVPGSAGATFAAELTSARRNMAARARLAALLAGAVPFGSSRSGDLWILTLGGAPGVIAALDPEVPTAPRLVCRGVATFAIMCTVHESTALPAIPAPGVAEQAAVQSAFERARDVLALLVGGDADVRRAAKRLARRPLDVPPPPARTKDRDAPLALGPLVETFFLRGDAHETLALHEASRDAIVASAVPLFAAALDRPRTQGEKELARRRAIAQRAVRSSAKPELTDRLTVTRRIIAHIDAAREAGDPLATSDAREEAFSALRELGDRTVVPVLVARAVTGDIQAVQMLAALGDARAAPHLVSVLRRAPARYRQLEAVVVRALATLGHPTPALRALLADNPMPSWREGIERGVLVKELVSALGILEDAAAGPALLEVLESQSQEYRAILPAAARALGRIRYLPALATLDRLLSSPKEPVTCEAIWAVGAIGSAHERARRRAIELLDGLKNLEPGAEIVRLTALAKIQARTGGGPRPTELKRAVERALSEPAFRQEETSRRRTWALESLATLAALPERDLAHGLFLGHEAVRYLVTRDDHRVRQAAEKAFAALGVPVPATRRYYSFVLADLERRGGLEALHDAVRDSLGVFRHNVATRLAEIADPSSVRPLAEATARLFAEPPTSTYEYDDAPPHLIAFVRALAKLNRPEGNDVLVEGLRTGNHQVRAVVAEFAPDDPRFVPELMAMLGDPRSFLRSRAERSLAAMGIRSHQSDAPPRPVQV